MQFFTSRSSVRIALFALLGLGFVLLVAKPIILSASDLGRHLTNGRLFLDEGLIPTTNFYSYTHPDFPFLNHHWGSGVLFELARRAGGFTGVSLFGLAIVFATVLLYLQQAWRRGGLLWAVTAAILVAPVFSSRVEIRPELFSYLLSGVFLWILFGVRDRSLPRWTLWLLPAFMLLWVNLHIYFFLGIGWIGAFFLEALIRRRSQEWQRLGIALATTCLMTLANPQGWKGALYPLLIFQNYAYAVAENQSALTMLARQYPPVTYFFIALAILALSWVMVLRRSWKERELPDVALLIITVFTSIIAWGAIRNFTIFAYVAMVSLAYAWSGIPFRRALSLMPVALALILFCVQPAYWGAVIRTVGIGVQPGTLDSIEFFKEHDLHGPIFNNYDIGGFLTYGLYPRERVFVDNRPEAYPGTFFTDTLLPMQSDEETWRTTDARFGFNVIFFFRHDATRWGRSFLQRRDDDPAWARVFSDAFTVVFLKRTPENAAVIEAFEIR